MMKPKDTATKLWTCPKCGVKLITKNLWHSCGRATLASWKQSMGPRAITFYNRFEEMIAACGEYHVAPAKTRIAFMAQVRFANIYRVTEHDMLCTLALPEPIISDRFIKIAEVVPGWWAHTLRITDVSQLDEEIQKWLCRSYQLMGMRERLKQKKNPTPDSSVDRQ